MNFRQMRWAVLIVGVVLAASVATGAQEANFRLRPAVQSEVRGLIEVFASELGVSEQELVEALHPMRNLERLAADKGLSDEQLQELVRSTIREHVAKQAQGRRMQQTRLQAQAEQVQQVRALAQAGQVVHARPQAQAQPVQQARPMAQAQQVMQARPMAQAQQVMQARPMAQAQQVMQARPMAQARQVMQARPTAQAQQLRQARPLAQTRRVQQVGTFAQAHRLRQVRPLVQGLRMQQAQRVRQHGIGLSRQSSPQMVTHFQQAVPLRHNASGFGHRAVYVGQQMPVITWTRPAALQQLPRAGQMVAPLVHARGIMLQRSVRQDAQPEQRVRVDQVRPRLTVESAIQVESSPVEP